MAGFQFKLTGFRQLEKNLLKLATKDAKRIGRRALKKAAEPILDAYQANTTVKTGRLQESEVIGTRLNRRQRRINGRPEPSEIEIHIGTNDPGGIQEEFGGRQAANPSLTPAWDLHGGTKALNTIGKELGAGYERAARRMKKG